MLLEASNTPEGLSLELTLGAPFVGGVIQMFLVGLATVQTFVFFKTNIDIHYLNKWMVFVLWVLVILHITFVFHVLFHYLIIVKGDFEGPVVWSFLAELTLELLVTNLTQILYTIRLWQITSGSAKRLVLFSVLACLIGLDISLNIWIPLQQQNSSIRQLLGTVFWPIQLNMGVTVVIDFILSIALIYFLAKSSKRLDWTSKSIKVILAYALNTGIVASFVSLACFVAYTTMPDNLISLALSIVLTGLYVNSLLAMLNARYYFQKQDNNDNNPEAVQSARTSVWLYNGRDFDRQPRLPPSSSANKSTINEIGLPLFQPREERQKVNDDIQLMQVKVTEERFDDSSDHS